MVRPKGLEPLTFWSVARRSILTVIRTSPTQKFCFCDSLLQSNVVKKVSNLLLIGKFCRVKTGIPFWQSKT